MLPTHVYLPARLPDGLGEPVEIRDADDWPHRVTADYLTLVESRPCATAAVIQELRAGSGRPLRVARGHGCRPAEYHFPEPLFGKDSMSRLIPAAVLAASPDSGVPRHRRPRRHHRPRPARSPTATHTCSSATRAGRSNRCRTRTTIC